MGKSPTIAKIATYIDSPLWNELCTFIEQSYSVLPSIEYSGCGMAPGFNVKYKKGGKSLCTLYPKRVKYSIISDILFIWRSYENT